jgi:hypothetical protein
MGRAACTHRCAGLQRGRRTRRDGRPPPRRPNHGDAIPRRPRPSFLDARHHSRAGSNRRCRAALTVHPGRQGAGSARDGRRSRSVLEPVRVRHSSPSRGASVDARSLDEGEKGGTLLSTPAPGFMLWGIRPTESPSFLGSASPNHLVDSSRFRVIRVPFALRMSCSHCKYS